MTTEKKYPLPPWDMDNAAEKLAILESIWNTRDPQQVAETYSENAEVRYGTAFLKGREEIRVFLAHKWQEQLGFKLKLDLWGALKGRMAVRFEYEWHNLNGKAFRAYGVQVYQFDEHGYAEMNYVSYNDQPL